MKFALALAFTVFVFSGFANAEQVVNMGSTVIEGGEGSAAEMKWNEILPNAEIAQGENTVGSTTIVLGEVTCTMLGSHGGSEKAMGGALYRCETLN